MNDNTLEEFIQTAKVNTQMMVARGYPAGQCDNESFQLYFEHDVMPDTQQTIVEDPSTVSPDQPNSTDDDDKSEDDSDTENEEKTENNSGTGDDDNLETDPDTPKKSRK